MNEKFTPGPWYIRLTGSTIVIEPNIAWVGYKRVMEDYANAALIAAASDNQKIVYLPTTVPWPHYTLDKTNPMENPYKVTCSVKA